MPKPTHHYSSGEEEGDPLYDGNGRNGVCVCVCVYKEKKRKAKTVEVLIFSDASFRTR